MVRPETFHPTLVHMTELDEMTINTQEGSKKRGYTPLIRLNVIVNSKEVTGIYDSGSNVTLINSSIVEDLKDNLLQNEQTFKTLSGVQKSFKMIKLPMRINAIEEEIEAHVIKNDNFSYDVLLGLDAIQKFRLLQDDYLNIHQRVKGGNIEPINKYKERQGSLYYQEETSEYSSKLTHLDRNQQKRLLDVISQNKTAFASNKYDIGLVKTHEAHIKLSENKYVSKKPYRCCIADQKEIKGQITKLLEEGLIEESDSPFAAPVTLAYKKEDGRRSRLCIDFRDLNKILVPEAQPFPRIEDIVVSARNCRWYSSFDINAAFWSVPIRVKDRHKTAFVTQTGHYQWKRLPFGLKIAPAIFQRILSNTLRRHNLQDFCANYIDDILVFSTSFEEHISHIQKLLQAIKIEGFKLKLSKCAFAMSSVKYLGHVLGYNSVRPHKDNLKSIKEFPAPNTKKKIRQFLGKINFYHKYIPDYTRTLEPLHQLLRSNSTFQWTPECDSTFTKIKEFLCQSPILAIFDPAKPTFLYTDASSLGVGAVLKQLQETGELLPVAYFSKKFTPSQAKKKAIYLECLAIQESLRYWQHWLLGLKFQVISDHKPLENLRVKARTDEELGDLIYYLSQYDFTITYSPGKTNQEADALSRNPVLESFENKDDILQIVNLVTLEDLKLDQITNQKEITSDRHSHKKGDLFYKKLRNKDRIFVSQRFGERLIKNVHAHYGHIGIGHLAAKLRPFYYFKRMDELIKKNCETCDICKRNKSRRIREIGPMSHLGPAKEPYEIMSLDTIGGFANNRSPKRYLHLLVDHFTRFAYTFPSRGQQAKDLIKFMTPIFEKNKVKLLLADQYTSINSQEFKSFLRRYGVTLILTAVDCPFSNGLNERLNQTLVNRIRCKINEHSRRPWSTIAIECTEEYNRTTHSVTGFSPQYLMKGVKSSIIPSSLEEPSNLSQDRKQAFQKSQAHHNMNKSRVDKKKKTHEFQIGDLVYVETGNRLNRKKLNPIRSGPFKILRRESSTIYSVDLNRRGLHGTYVHSSKLLPFRGGEM